MGCWNGTCFLSNLSIRHGDSIKVQLLVPFSYTTKEDIVNIDEYKETDDPRSINGVCYANGIAQPLLFPINGSYNDYGSLEEIDYDDVATKVLLEFIKVNIQSGELMKLQDDNDWIHKSLDKNFKPKTGLDAMGSIDPKNLEKFFDDVERGTIIYKMYDGKFYRLRFAMMHSDIYDDFINKNCNNKGWDNKSIRDREQDLFDNLTKKPDITNGYVKKIMKEYKEKHNEDMKEDDIRSLLELVEVTRDMDSSKWNYLDHHDISNIYTDTVKNMMKSVSDEDKKKYIRLYGDRSIINFCLLKLRKSWDRPAGSGSQDDNEDFILNFNKMVNKFVKKNEKVREKRYAM